MKRCYLATGGSHRTQTEARDNKQQKTRPLLLGRGVVPTVFWGTGGARGWASRGMAETPAALILMSDWCGPADAADATTIENRGA
jgi:hypothetical protein